MLFEWLVIGFLFAFSVIVTMTIFTWLVERRQRAERQNLESDIPLKDENALTILGSWTPVLASQSPVAPAKRSAIVQELREAGFYHPNAIVEYQAIRAFLVLVPIFGVGILAVLGNAEDIPMLALIAAVLAGLGFSLPRMFLTMRARSRAREIERGLPVALDLLTLGLSSGQNIFNSLGVVSRETRNAYPVLSEELQIVREQAELGHLSLALHQFADRTNVGEIRNLSALLAQNEQLGADISTSLHEYAHHLRVTMRQRAEAQANRANFWMLFPTILCLVLPATLILVAPAFFEFTKGREQLRELSNTNKSKLDLANPLQSNTDRAAEPNNQIPLVPAR